MLRRLSVALLLCLCLTLRSARGQAPEPQTSSPPLHARRLHPNFYVIEGTSTGDADVPNLLAYVTPAGVILVDPWFARDHDRIVAAVREITVQPIRYVINTHFHSDHTGANGLFAASGPASVPASVIDIVAHANTRTHMLDAGLPGPANITFTDEASLYLGGKEVRLRYLGRGHTDGDIAVFFPEWRTVALGDMMAGTRGVTNPVVDYAHGGSLAPWPASLDRALAFDPETVIPGHGAITGRAALIAHRDKITAIIARLRALDAGHKSKDEIRATLIRDFDFKPINLRALDGLIAEFKH